MKKNKPVAILIYLYDRINRNCINSFTWIRTKMMNLAALLNKAAVVINNFGFTYYINQLVFVHIRKTHKCPEPKIN